MLSLQSYSFIPTSINKPTRVYRDLDTLIDNTLINKCDFHVSSGIIVSDISDHYSQFCTLHSQTEKFNTKRVRRDFSGFSESPFSHELPQLLNNENMFSPKQDADIAFSTFYNTLNSLVNKQALLKVVSKRKLKQFSKPWITSGIKKLIKEKTQDLPK